MPNAQPAQTAAPLAKQCKGMAIGALIIGLLSLFIIVIFAGIYFIQGGGLIGFL